MFYREAGQFSTSYSQDRRLLQLRQDRTGMLVLLAIGLVGIPFAASDYWLSAILIPWLVLALVALGQNILMGYAVSCRWARRGSWLPVHSLATT